MKKYLTIAMLWISVSAFAQDPSGVIDKKVHKMVMQFTAGDSIQQMSVIIQIGNIKEAWPNAMIEVICHGPGLDLLIAAKSKVGKQVGSLSSEGVVFAACNNSMKRRKVKKEELLSSSIVVPSAMLELVSKQEEKWAYVKGGN